MFVPYAKLAQVHSHQISLLASTAQTASTTQTANTAQTMNTAQDLLFTKYEHTEENNATKASAPAF